MIRIVSFGYGHGPAPTADVTLDVRRLFRNPASDPVMRHMTGLDRRVAAHVDDTRGVPGTVDEAAMLVHLLAGIGREVTVAFGCSGGRHRSVAMAEQLAVRLRNLGHKSVRVEHRDIGKPLLPVSGEAGQVEAR
jgi:RNase adaptor protein for sRNA GlmZ degradation